MAPRRKKLSNQERLFVHEYLVDTNASQAALRAGYAKNTAEAKAPAWVKKRRVECPPNKRHVWDAVQEAMDKRSGKIEVTADRVLAELCKIAFSNPEDYFEWAKQQPDKDGRPAGKGGVELISSDDLTRDQKAAISEISESFGQYGNSIKMKFNDRQRALEMIARHLGMFNDGLNLNIQGLGDMILGARKRQRETQHEEASE